MDLFFWATPLLTLGENQGQLFFQNSRKDSHSVYASPQHTVGSYCDLIFVYNIAIKKYHRGLFSSSAFFLYCGTTFLLTVLQKRWCNARTPHPHLRTHRATSKGVSSPTKDPTLSSIFLFLERNRLIVHAEMQAMNVDIFCRQFII